MLDHSNSYVKGFGAKACLEPGVTCIFSNGMVDMLKILNFFFIIWLGTFYVNYTSSFHLICLLINSLPDPVFIYFSNRKATFSSLKAKYATSFQGLKSFVAGT
jgi:hypothetical protein